MTGKNNSKFQKIHVIDAEDWSWCYLYWLDHATCWTSL